MFVFTLYIGVEPFYNMDMLAYMAIVQKMDGKSDVGQIHENTYQLAEESLSPDQFTELSTGTAYRKHLWQNPESFNEQLAFYVIKPLYLLSVFSFYKSGFNLLFATVLPSLVSYFLIALLVLYWLNRLIRSPWLCTWLSIFIMVSVPLVELGKSSAPDAISTLFLLLGCYLFVERTSLWSSSLFFILAIATRPDSIILILLLFLLPFMGKWSKKVSPLALLLCMGIFFLAYLIPQLFLEDVSWTTLFHHAFIDRVLYPLSDPPTLSASAYLEVISENLVPQGYFTRMTLMVIVLFAGMVGWRRVKTRDYNFFNWSFNELFMLIIILTIIIRFFLFPAFLGRFMAPFLLLAGILFVKEVFPLLEAGFSSQDIPIRKRAEKREQPFH
ncbi:hypothetical protein [Nafulsella turpanensis]|uniref:hypothetical protein n=1 Tax=Nafulsella turpanensis TaxID=1265690 RepID=UPI00034B5119|nr:hypothetical protein [Nafulsella turpanensis]